MGYSRKLIPPIVAAAVTTVAVTNFATIVVVKGDAASGLHLFQSIWPILLTSALSTILVMSLLYQTLRDLIVELEQREASAQHNAVHDPLTGLANRALLVDRIEIAIGRLRRNKEKFALLLLDLGSVDKGDSQTRQYLIQGGFWGGYCDPGIDERRGMGLS